VRGRWSGPPSMISKPDGTYGTGSSSKLAISGEVAYGVRGNDGGVVIGGGGVSGHGADGGAGGMVVMVMAEAELQGMVVMRVAEVEAKYALMTKLDVTRRRDVSMGRLQQ